MISLFHFPFFKSQSHKLDTFKTQEYIYLVASFSISSVSYTHLPSPRDPLHDLVFGLMPVKSGGGGGG
ncbi:hypothetical protein ACQ4LK_00650, partial [Bacillus pumilus]